MAARIPTVERAVQTRPVSGKGLSLDLPETGLPKAEVEIARQSESIFAKQLQDINQVAVLAADLSTGELESKLLWDPSSGALTTKGANAAGVYQPTMEAYDKHVSDTAAGLANDTQRNAYTRIATNRRASVDRQLMKHVTTEGVRYDTEVTDSSLKLEKQRVAQDPTNVNSAIAIQRAVLTDFARRTGKDSTWLELHTKNHVSDTHKVVIAQKLANGDDLGAEQYRETNSSEIIDIEGKLRSSLGEASVNGEAARSATEIWETQGPKDDDDAVNLDTMFTEAEKDKNSDVVKATKTLLKERKTAHDASAQERKDANMSAIWDAYDKATPVEEIYTMPEYLALTGTGRREVRDKIDSYMRVEAKEDRVDQQINFANLSANPDLLRVTDIDDMLRRGELSVVGHRSLTALSDPRKSQQAKTATRLLDFAKTKRLFNPQDDTDNLNQWADASELLEKYIVDNPDRDFVEFAKELTAEIELGFKERWINRLWFGQPATESAKELKRTRLEGLAGVVTDPARQTAIDTLRAAGKPETDANINFVMEKQSGTTK